VLRRRGEVEEPVGRQAEAALELFDFLRERGVAGRVLERRRMVDDRVGELFPEGLPFLEAPGVLLMACAISERNCSSLFGRRANPMMPIFGGRSPSPARL
jgi:hypothetical protein